MNENTKLTVIELTVHLSAKVKNNYAIVVTVNEEIRHICAYVNMPTGADIKHFKLELTTGFDFTPEEMTFSRFEIVDLNELNRRTKCVQEPRSNT